MFKKTTENRTFQTLGGVDNHGFPEDAILEELHAETAAGMPKRQAYLRSLTVAEGSEQVATPIENTPEPVVTKPVEKQSQPAPVLYVPMGVTQEQFLHYLLYVNPDATQQDVDSYFKKT